MHRMTVRHYRPEIDGLRAISVIGVVLFHVGLGFPGGFVGVDVFFVISGYLITGILARQLDDGRFSLVDFWARRIRRIMPAALVMVLGTLLIGGFMQTPDRYSSLARSAMAHVLMSSNCYFTVDAGYFAESSDLEPLLHTWSLSVEEQFYLVFPLAVTLLWRRCRKHLVLVLSAVALLSLVWSCRQVTTSPKDAFFLLPARMWELLAGALLALTPLRHNSRPLREVLSALGLLAIFASMLLYDRETAFPGLAALPPVLGAMSFLSGGGQTFAGRLLSLRPLVWTGLISYSLYLWHWPILVFLREMSIELTPARKSGLVALSFLLGYLSWRWIETPFRAGSFLRTNRRALTFGLTSALCLYGSVLGIRLSGGLPSRLPDDLEVLWRDMTWNGSEFTSSRSKATPIGERSDGPLDFIFWGDSHGASASPAVDAAAKALGLRGRAYLNNGVPPVTNLWFADMEGGDPEDMVAMNERVLREIVTAKPKMLLIVGRWVARCEGYNALEMEGELPGHRFITMVVDSDLPEPTFDDSAGALTRQLRAMNARLTEAGIPIVLLQQVPESTINRVASRFFWAERSTLTADLPQFSTTFADFQARQGPTMARLAALADENLTVIDPSPRFLSPTQKLQIYAERAYYRDDDHLTRAGSMRYLAPVMEEIFRPLTRDESQ